MRIRTVRDSRRRNLFWVLANTYRACYLSEVFCAALLVLAFPARSAGRAETRAMSSSVISEDVRPLVNSETLPSVNPVNLLGASSFAVRADNANPHRKSRSPRASSDRSRRARSPRRTSSRRTANERTKQRLTSFTIRDPRLTIRAVFFGLFVVLNDKLRGWYAALDRNAVLDGIPGAGPPGSLEHVETFRTLRDAHLRHGAGVQHQRRGVELARLQVQTEPASGVHQRRLRVDAQGDVAGEGLVRGVPGRGDARAQRPGFLLRPAPARVAVHDARAPAARAEPARVRVRRAAAEEGKGEGGARVGQKSVGLRRDDARRGSLRKSVVSKDARVRPREPRGAHRGGHSDAHVRLGDALDVGHGAARVPARLAGLLLLRHRALGGGAF